jgi:hypothetical protein
MEEISKNPSLIFTPVGGMKGEAGTTVFPRIQRVRVILYHAL